MDNTGKHLGCVGVGVCVGAVGGGGDGWSQQRPLAQSDWPPGLGGLTTW